MRRFSDRQTGGLQQLVRPLIPPGGRMCQIMQQIAVPLTGRLFQRGNQPGGIVYLCRFFIKSIKPQRREARLCPEAAIASPLAVSPPSGKRQPISVSSFSPPVPPRQAGYQAVQAVRPHGSPTAPGSAPARRDHCDRFQAHCEPQRVRLPPVRTDADRSRRQTSGTTGTLCHR